MVYKGARYKLPACTPVVQSLPRHLQGLQVQGDPNRICGFELEACSFSLTPHNLDDDMNPKRV